MSCYVTLQDVKDFGSMPSEDIDSLEVLYVGITLKIAAKISSIVDARLIKRYPDGVPFTSPYPDAVILHVAKEVAWRLWLKRGFNPNGATDQALLKEHEEFDLWLKEAADSQNGLIELPSTQGGASGIDQGGPYSYSEQSPYAWITLQAETGREEDGD